MVALPDEQPDKKLVPRRFMTRAWGVARKWILISGEAPSAGYVLEGRPFVRFEERGRSLDEIREFYGNVRDSVTQEEL